MLLSHSRGSRNVSVTQVTPLGLWWYSFPNCDGQTRAKHDLRPRGHDDQGLRSSRDVSLSHQVSQPDQVC